MCILSEQIYLLKRKIKAVFCRIPYYICGVLPIQKNKVVFSAFEGGGYCCNPKYIAEELMRRQKNINQTKYQLVWLVNDTSKPFPDGIYKVKNNLWNRAYHLSTAHVWIDNARKNYGTRKRNGQFYLLTWHGPVGFKPVGRLRGASFSRIAELVSRYDAGLVDVLLSNSDWCSNIWKNAFWDEPVKLLGSPRCDILLNHRKEQYERIRKEYHLPKDCRIVMYAPTFRGGSQGKKRTVFYSEFSLDFARLIKVLEDKFGGTWYIFLRLHPQLSLRSVKAQGLKNNRFIDISERDDLYEALAGVDAFLSDYSSAAFDAAYMRIPVFLYVDDMDDYTLERGELTWKLEDIPFPMAKNNMELEKKIYGFEMSQYQEKLTETFLKIGLLEDGRASERVADLIEEKLKL